MPDFITKIAFDPNSRIHFEVAGLERTFRTFNQATNTTFKKAGVGGSANLMLGISLDNFRSDIDQLLERWRRPLSVSARPGSDCPRDGSISLIHSGGFTEGFETNVKNTLVLRISKGGTGRWL